MTATGGDTAGRGIGVRWRICGLMTLAGFVAYLLRTNMSVAGAPMAAELGLTHVQLGVVLGGFAWGYAIFQLPGGVLGDRMGPRRAVAGMALSWAVLNLLVGLTHRLVDLTNRLAELSGGRVEARLARFFLKLAADIGQKRADGVFIALALSRQELADMIGTTIETAIRIMSRWGKDDIVRTEKDGFLVVNREALENMALS